VVAPTAAGSVKKKRVPPPALSVTPIRPPCRSTIRWQIGQFR
jgi:hypothetical protein